MVPSDAELTDRPAEIPAWDDMPDDLKPVLARQMEVYAGFMEHTDFHAGRLIDALEELGLLDDTLIYCIIGDNGASAEGTPRGTFNELLVLNGASQLETTEFMASKIDLFGTPEAYNHYAVGWAHAMDTPPVDQAGCQPLGRDAQRHDRVVAERHRGEGRDPQPVPPCHRRRAHGPRSRRTARPDLRQRDPAGTARGRIDGVSFDDATAVDRHTTQYFEMFVNRGIYHQGWTAVTRHSTPWVMAELPSIDRDVWELYGPDDWTQAHDLAAEQPERLAHLQRLFLIEATKYNVLPLDDRRVERFNPDMAGRPQLIRGNRQVLFGDGPVVREFDHRPEEQVARRDG